MNDKNNDQENDTSIFDNALVRSGDVLPGVIHLLPVTSRPFFPGQAVPLMMEEKHWAPTISSMAKKASNILGVVLADAPTAESAKPSDFRRIGVAGIVHRIQQIEDRLQVMVEFVQRIEIKKIMTDTDPFMAQVDYLPEPSDKPNREIRAYALAIINTIKELLPLNPLYAEELRMFVDKFGQEDPSHLADFAASLTSSNKKQLQGILDEVEILPRMEKVMVLLSNELEMARAQHEIRQSVERRINKGQREFFLREQLKSIQQELGIAKDDRTTELEKFNERLADLTLTKQAQERVEEEMNKMSMLETGSPEYAVTRNYLDWITLLPWGKHSDDKLDLAHARKTLDKDHYGLEDVKERILEFLAVGMMKGQISGSIILFVGPPGVGKTSIGRSIAEALGREFFRFSLGGIRDEAEIKGHRRTYIGAMPGKFIQSMKEVGTENPVIMLDEIDKVGASYHGDPASALLEVLDPEQNIDFLDHFLDLRFDLSKVLFLCTANQLDTIPRPLLDRMEVIKLSGYITSEKLQIARKYLLPRQLNRAGLKRNQVKIGARTMRAIIEGYARDAGVRRLEKQIGKIVRKCVIKIMEGEKTPISIAPEDLNGFLGNEIFREERSMSGAGIVTGLAWTAMGGATLTIEAARTHGFTRGFKLTGQLGDIMRESAEIAYGYVLGHAEELGANPSFFEKSFIHLHVPAGATPKDGPSAGITMASALLSLARNEELARPLAMTGEMTLTGEVFPVGGIREKVIAARRSGIKELIIPKDNEGDYADVPEHITKGIKVHFVATFNEVVPLLFKKQRRGKKGKS